MKSFFKTVLAVVVGMLIAGIICTMFFTCTMVGLVAAAGSGSSEVTKTKPGDVLMIKLNSEVNERTPQMPFSFDMMGNFSTDKAPGLDQIMDAIAVAEADDNIAGIYLNTDGMTAAPATYEAIRQRLATYREQTGKWIVAYNSGYTAAQYYLASVADIVAVNAIGSVTWDGMSTVLPYPKGLMDKLGVEMQVFRCGQYKSAVEMFMTDHISPANYEQTSVYLQSIWDQMVAEITASRPDVSADTLNALADRCVSYMQPDELAATGLVDTMAYKRDIENIILSMNGADELHGVSVKALAGNYDTTFPTKGRKPISVIFATGEVSSNATGSDANIYYDDLIAQLRDVEDDDDVEAIVLRVNSPGGSGYASEQIWDAIMRVKEAGKKVVVSMGDYAASGGYYISAPADCIVAEPNTITGSIGVFGTIPNVSGLTTGKLGVNFEEVKTHAHGQMTLFRPLDAWEKAQVQHGIDAFYDLFTRRVAEGRAISQDSVKVIAGGRVWTGSDALRIGLVDTLGGIDTAIAIAAQLAGIDPDGYYTEYYSNEKDPMTQLLDMLGDESDDLYLRAASWLGHIGQADLESLRLLRRLGEQDHIQARCMTGIVM